MILTIGSIAFAGQPGFAQTPPPAAEKGAADKPKADEKPAAEPADVDPEAEVFVPDADAKKLMTKFDVLTYTGPPVRILVTADDRGRAGGGPDDRTRVNNMVAKNENLNAEFLKRYVDYFAAELTRRDYINAIISPPPSAAPGNPQSRGLERAVDALTKPIVDARYNKNAEFIAVYNKILFESRLVAVLENNYFSRIDAMIVLGMAGSNAPIALDLYASQLKKEDQIVWVKIWACRGLTAAAQNGAIPIDQSKAINGAEGLIAFLDSDPKLPWPARMRAMEAFGSLRLATANKVGGKVDAASVVFRNLIDEDAPFEVRAWAAWALGMMKVSGSVTPYNFTMIGREIGELVIDLGSEIVEEFDDKQANFDKEKEEAHHLSALLLYQVLPALAGEEGIIDSGLLNSTHPSLAPAKPLLTKLDEKSKAVAREAYELIRSGGTGQKDKRNDLDSKVADLKSFIGQLAPKNRRLLPDGPEFPAVASQVAGAAGR